ncbi:MAG: alpha/beta fold hydrolase [Pseudomonadota bacterium]
MSALFDPIEPYETGRLPVGDGHVLYYERSGRRGGRPVVFLHGGPGSGAGARHRRYYDPQHWDIILFDQRGCGRSTPFLSLEANTTAHLIADLDVLRRHLGLERWTVFGPSWGSTLAIAYSQAFPETVEALVVEAIFLGTRSECDWFHSRRGAGAIFPDALERLFDSVPDEISANTQRFQRWALDQMMLELAEGAPALDRLSPDTPLSQLEQSWLYRWSAYEERIAHLDRPPDQIRADFTANGADWIKAHSLIEAWYFAHDCFLAPGELLANAERLTLPVRIIHSRYDVVCPSRAAFHLAEAAPDARLEIVPSSGHIMTDQAHALVVETFTELSAEGR